MLTVPGIVSRKIWCWRHLLVLAALIPVFFFARVWGQSREAVSAGGGGLLNVPAKTSISVNVNLVLVPVTGMDRAGRTALGLRRDNFKVFEDGAPQAIASFSNQDVPSSVARIPRGSTAGFFL